MALLYIFIFLAGLFAVWFLGRKEHYDEEKVIDLVLAGLVVALVVARGAFLLSRSGGAVMRNALNAENVWLVSAALLDLRTGYVWWAGAIAFALVTLLLLRRWKWPVWPMLGLSTLGMSGALFVSSLLFAFVGGRLEWGQLAAASALLLLVVYLYFLGGMLQITGFWADLQRGYRNKVKERRNKRESTDG